MTKLTSGILEGDEESDLISFFVEACDIDLRDYHRDRRILTRDVFEKNLSKIMKIVERRSSRRKTYLILGYFILSTGAKVPDSLRVRIIDAAKWKYEEGLWDERFARERKFYLKDLRDKIRAHKSGMELHLILLKNTNDEDFTHGVIGLDQFWEYVDSGEIGLVRHINLDSCGLSTIPEPILELNSLESLSLDNNFLEMLPKSIDNLKSLRRLYLNGNQFRIFPKALSQLSSLEILSINRNYFTRLPSFIKSLRSLKKLYLRNNFISKIPHYLQENEFLIII